MPVSVRPALLFVPFLASLTACDAPPARSAPLRLWHTFGASDTAWLNEELHAVAPHDEIEATLLPFGRAQNRIEGALATHPEPSTDCPDLVRIDATWLPSLAAGGHLRPIINEAKTLDGLRPEAVELVEWNQRHWGLPQAVEPLALLADHERVAAAGLAWPPASPEALTAAIHALAAKDRPGLVLRPDGYDVIPLLRAAGADLLDPASGTPTIDLPAAAAVLDHLRAEIVAGAIATPPERGDASAGAVRAFVERRAALLVAGPWTLPEPPPFAVDVVPWPAASDGRPTAPRGGHVYAVPRCATQPDRAWKLAAALTAPEREAGWAQRRGIVPTHTAVPVTAPLGTGFLAALSATRALPRHPLTPRLFDDLTPAVRAVLDGEATGAEALAGVTRAWRRLAGLEPPSMSASQPAVDAAPAPGGPR